MILRSEQADVWQGYAAQRKVAGAGRLAADSVLSGSKIVYSPETEKFAEISLGLARRLL